MIGPDEDLSSLDHLLTDNGHVLYEIRILSRAELYSSVR
jgi:hypothetical protein